MTYSFDMIKNTSELTMSIERYSQVIESEEFRTALLKDLEQISAGIQSPDEFFEEHAKYVLSLIAQQRHKIALELWLNLLENIKIIDEKTYASMHKGTPFYFIGIIFILNDRWIDGLEWLDYAFEQDTRRSKQGIIELPATWTLSFDPRSTEIKRPNDAGISAEILKKMEDLFKDLSRFDSSFTLAISTFRNKIKSKFLNASSNRSIRSAWCTYVANLMGKSNILRCLHLGPDNRRIQVTAQKSFVELTLILESLLREKYAGSRPNPTLANLLSELVGPKLFNKYDVYDKNIKRIKLISTILSRDYIKILTELRAAEDRNVKLAVSYQLAYEVRNHSHHIFNEEKISAEIFDNIFLRLSHAIINTIDKIY